MTWHATTTAIWRIAEMTEKFPGRGVNIKTETAAVVWCPHCKEMARVIFDANPFNDKDFVYCPWCGREVER